MFCDSHFLIICISFIVIWQPTVSEPAPPESLKWEEIYSTSIVVSWDQVKGIKYWVKAEANPSTFKHCDNVGEDAGEVSTFEIRTISDGTRLEANTLYDIGVCAVDDNGKSAAKVIKELETGPDPPMITSASLDAQNQIVVTWTAPCGGASDNCDDDDQPAQYTVVYSSSTVDKNKIVERSSPDTLPVTTVTLDDVISNTEYQITVMTMTSFIPNNHQYRKMYSDPSDESIVVTMVKKIDALTTTTVSDTEIDISWSKPVEGGGHHAIGEYVVKWTPQNGDGNGRKIVNGGTSATRITGLTSNQQYSITVGASEDQVLVGIESDQEEAITLPSKVDTPTAQPVSSSSVSLNWEEVAGNADKTYTVSWEPSQGPGVSENKESIEDTSYQIDSLISNTLYTLKVKAVNDVGSGEESEGVTAATLVKQIDVLTTTTASDTEIDISWSKPDEGGGHYPIGEYLVKWTTQNDDGSGSKTVNDGTSATRITGLRSNQKYSITVGASEDQVVVGIESDQEEAITLPSKVDTPTAQPVSSSSVSLNWEDVAGNAGKTFTVSWESSQGPGVSGNEESIKETSYQIDNLISNTLYTFKVIAVNEAGSGDESDGVPAATMVEQIDVLPPTVASDTEINISWSKPDEGGGHHPIGEYLVKWTPQNGDGSGSKTVNDDSDNIATSITGLTSNQQYSVTVGASKTGVVVGIESIEAKATTLPTKPVKPIATTISSTIIFLEWTNADNGTADKSYNVSWKLDQSVGNIDNITETSKNISELISNSKYTFTVSAVNNGGTGDISESEEAITFPAKANQPTSNSATASSISLQWAEKEEGPVDRTYMVFWRVSPNSVTYNETATSNTESTINNLNGSTRHTFRLRSENEAGPALESSDEVWFLTTPDKLQSPNSSVGTDPTTTSIVNWSKPEGGDEIEGYTLEWTATSGDLPQDYIRHEEGNNSYTQTKSELMPGEIYTINITANNSGGSSSVALQHRAYPEAMSGLEAKKNEEDPSNYLDIAWVKPNGTGDNIKVEYTNQNDNSLKIAETKNFDTTVLSISVVPGNTYDITAYAISGNLNNTNQLQPLKMNSKPAAVNITGKEVTKNSIKLTWEFEGFAESVKIEVLNNPQLDAEINDTTQNEYTIMDLLPGTKYKVDLYTMITNVTNQKESSEVTSEELQTKEEIIPSNVGLIVGLTVTGILLQVLIILGVLYYRRRRNGSKKPSVPTKPTTTQSPNNNGPYPPKERREVRLTDFKNHVEFMHANSDMQFSAEYRQFSDVVINPSVSASSQEENKPKNRYKNVLAYDATRVVLSNVSDAAEDYINANFIGGYRHDREYIAAQGPLPNTKDDFWKMVWEQDCKIIVMVTQTVEGGKVKCDHYWPYDNKTIAVADMTLKVLDEVDSGEWVVRKLELHKEYETRVISHFHYTAWPDHGVPKTTKSLVQFVQLVRNHVEKDGLNDGPPVVHCSAGVGRTGTFIAIDHLLQHLKEHPYVDIYGIVYEMRKQRNLMVQTEGQYIFLHDVVEDYLDKKFDEDQEPLYENAGFVKDPIYENTNYGGKPLDGSS